MVTTRRFELHRDHDVSGVSGTGVVADGVRWPDGSVSIRWRGDRPSVVFWHSLADAEQVHGHGGATRFVWLDDDHQPAASPGRGEVGWYVPAGHQWCPRCGDTNFNERTRLCITCTHGDSGYVDGRFAKGWPGRQAVAHVPLLEPDQLTKQVNDTLYRDHPEVPDGQ